MDEAVQDTFVAIWRDARRFDAASGEAAAWIWTIAIRRLISALRRSRSAQQTILLARMTPEPLIMQSAEDTVLVGVEHGDLSSALACLSPDLRAAIEATVLDGLTHREAADLLGVPLGTVKTRVMRAKVQLRRYLA
ncbi:RNA polymerase ECF-subfamily sigma factor [[Actinomadura] parvosata subsp. kistnae]|nr:RNA polymerase ECF-subfamily sigma factor [Actinomadura parvosata subsp. kistnae]